jgi:magnesium-transporting ATPase (P-type)
MPHPQLNGPVPMTLTNLFQYISFTAPILVIFFITLFSIMQNNLEKGLIFNMGIVILSTIVYILKNVIRNKQSDYASPFCNVIPGPFTVASDGIIFNAPSMSTSILSFSSTYLIYPMLNNNQHNYTLLVFLIGITSINAVVEYNQQCSDIMGIVFGLLLGIIFAIVYYNILYMSKKSNLVYFSDPISNNVQCSKPTKQNFKCEVYKDGKPYNGTIT